MRPATRLLPKKAASLATSNSQNPISSAYRVTQATQRPSLNYSPTCLIRGLSCTRIVREKKDYATRAKELNQKGLDDQEKGFNNQLDNAIGEAKELQARTPWHREGSDKPPVKRARSAGAMTKGLSLLSCQYQNQVLNIYNRQTPHNPLAPPKAHPTPHNPRQKFR